MFAYSLLHIIGAVISAMPKRCIEVCAWMGAIFFFDVIRLRRALMLANIKRAFGDQYSDSEMRKIGRRSIYHFLLTAFEVFYSQHHDIAGDIQIEGRPWIDQALTEKRGVYIACCHLGNWEAMGAKYTRSITPSYVVVKKIGVKGVNRYVEERRQKNGFLGIMRKRKGDGYRQIIETLDRNQIVGFVMDQSRPGEPVLPFFGHPARTNTSFAAILKRRPAAILPSYVERHSFNRHTIHILEPVKMQNSDNPEQDVIANSIRMNEVVEDMVRRLPEQYFWLHNRWKS